MRLVRQVYFAALVLLAISACMPEGMLPVDDTIMQESIIPNARPGEGGVITFTSTRAGELVPGGGWDIFAVNGDGSNMRRLTANPNAFHYIWSPDGRYLAYAVERYSPPDHAYIGQICIVDADGQNQRCFDSGGASEGWPTWSPDGSQIAFSSNRNATNQLYIMNVDGTGVQQLTNFDTGIHAVFWSPDGSRLLFPAFTGKGELYSVRPDGLEQRRLIGDDLSVERFAWSPNGSFIAFLGTSSDEDQGIYVINSDGSNLHLLAPVTAYIEDVGFSWSPQNDQLAYIDNRPLGDSYGVEALYAINVGGGSPRHLSDIYGDNEIMDEQHASAPAWSPDGIRIAFLALFDPEYISHDIYVINPDGSDLRRVTSEDTLKTNLAWMPGTESGN
jgi:TolB protein